MGKRLSIPFNKLLEMEYSEDQVWEFDNDNEGKVGQDETWLYQITTLPVNDLANREVITKVRLSNGSIHHAVIGNVSINNLRSTQQFLCLSIKKDNNWFNLARYFDVDYNKRGPNAFAQFLAMDLNEIYPITYDLSKVVVGKDDVIKGIIKEKPSEILSDKERMNLILEDF